MDPVFELTGVDPPAPDHTTVSRRAMTLPLLSLELLPDGPLHILIDSTGLKGYGAGEWLKEKCSARTRRSWRKLHLAVDADTNTMSLRRLRNKTSMAADIRPH